jgi:Family of unknown function (DUF6174)
LHAHPAKKNRIWVWYFVLLAVLTVTSVTVLVTFNLRQQLKPEQLAAAKALWKEKGPRDFDMKYRQTAGDEPETYVVHVRDRQVESVERNGQPLEERQRKYHSMLALFGYIERFLEIDAEPNRPRTYTVAVFDPNDGHLLHYVRRVMGTSERAEITVTELTPAAPSSN